MFLTRLVKLVYWFREREIRLKKQIVELDGMQTQAKVQTALAEALLEMKKRHIETLVTQFSRTPTPEVNNENVQLAEHALNTYLRLFNEGAKLALPATAPDAVKEELPIDAGGKLAAIPEAPIPIKALKAAGENDDDGTT